MGAMSKPFSPFNMIFALSQLQFSTEFNSPEFNVNIHDGPIVAASFPKIRSVAIICETKSRLACIESFFCALRQMLRKCDIAPSCCWLR